MVGFRAFVQRHAQQLGLRGSVSNRPDGAVECDVEGPRVAVEQMLQLLWRGPISARVDDVTVEYRAPSGDLPSMRVSA